MVYKLIIVALQVKVDIGDIESIDVMMLFMGFEDVDNVIRVLWLKLYNILYFNINGQIFRNEYVLFEVETPEDDDLR